MARILFVDDDDAMRGLLRSALADEHEVFEAEDGDEALRVRGELPPDLVVLDWKMPRRWGGEVLDALKGRNRALPVIVLTAEQGPQHEILAKWLGADVFLRKPFSPVELTETVRRLLDR